MRIPDIELVPKIFSKYEEFKIVSSIKEILSKAEYTELSIEENIWRKSSEIVDIIVLDVEFK